MELIVAMMITGILISIGGLCFLVVSKQMGNFKQRSEVEYDLHRSASLLYNDFASPGIIYTGVGGIRIHRLDGTDVFYQFERAHITRQIGNAKETMGSGAENYEMSYNGEPGDNNGVIDALRITLKHNDEVYDLHLVKQYVSAERLQIDEP